MKVITLFLFLLLSLTGYSQKVSFEEPPSEVTIRVLGFFTDTVYVVVDNTLQKAVMEQKKHVVVYHPTNKELEGVQFCSVPTFYIEDRKVKVDMYYKPTPTTFSISSSRLLKYNNGTTFLTQD